MLKQIAWPEELLMEKKSRRLFNRKSVIRETHERQPTAFAVARASVTSVGCDSNQRLPVERKCLQNGTQIQELPVEDIFSVYS